VIISRPGTWRIWRCTSSLRIHLRWGRGRIIVCLGSINISSSFPWWNVPSRNNRRVLLGGVPFPSTSRIEAWFALSPKFSALSRYQSMWHQNEGSILPIDCKLQQKRASDMPQLSWMELSPFQ
jgi:hypothetical protein